jgi:broad specificity polyphosphatase/5'/3'-nucleotidase SurE
MAIKTEIEVERDFYSFIKNGSLGNTIKGSVYRPDMRPANAKTEDLIVKFLAGLDEQIQTGVVILNIYVPDVKNTDGRMVRDAARIGVLQAAIRDFVDKNDETEYWMETDGTPTSMKNEEIGQWCVTARIHFRRISE